MEADAHVEELSTTVSNSCLPPPPQATIVVASGNNSPLTEQYAKLLVDQVFKRSSIRWNITYQTTAAAAAAATAATATATPCSPVIRLSSSSQREVAWGSDAAEGYDLTSSPCTGVTIAGVDQHGLLYGIGRL